MPHHRIGKGVENLQKSDELATFFLQKNTMMHGVNMIPSICYQTSISKGAYNH